MYKYFIFFSIFSLSLLSLKEKSITDTATYSPNNYVNVIVEIPAGTNKKIEFNYELDDFIVDQKNGKDRIISFLPYPGNYGFIPSTIMNKDRGGDGDALDIIVLSSTIPTGTIIETIPIGVLLLEDGGEIDNKLIAIPANPEHQNITSITLESLKNDYPGTLDIIKTWFTSYKGPRVIKFIGWGDENEAMKEIEKWAIKPVSE